MQAGKTPLQTHAQSHELKMALLMGGADPSALVDEDGNTLLHNAETAEEITTLLRSSPLIDVNATNKVRSSVVDHLLTIGIRSCMASVY